MKSFHKGSNQLRRNSIGHIGIGLIFILVAFPLIIWNEIQSIIICKNIRKGMDIVPSVSADRVDPAKEGQLIHVKGKTVTQAPLTDPIFGVTDKVLRLRRQVEMYQWNEVTSSMRKKMPDSSTKLVTSYSYQKIWSYQLINSSAFNAPSGHENPGTMPYQSMEQLADKVTLGVFTLPASAVRKIGGVQQISLRTDISLPAGGAKQVQQYNDGLYLGNNPALPQIGDVRVKIVVVPQQEVSIIARQSENTLIPYQTQTGQEIFWVRQGLLTVRNIFHVSESPKIGISWRIRAGSFFFLLIGLKMILKAFFMRCDVQPSFINNIVAAGINRIALLSTGLLFTLTMSTVWITFRPLPGLALFITASILAFLIKGKIEQVGSKVTPIERAVLPKKET